MTLIPPSMSHIGTTVTDLAAAIEWYQQALGMYLLAGPLEVVEDGSDLGNAAATIYGEGFSRFQFAHLCGADGVGIELFQFDNPPTSQREESFEFWRTGINHLAITTADVAGTAERIAAHGGRLRSAAVVVDPAKGYTIQYAEDPWGTVIELCSHPYAQMWG